MYNPGSMYNRILPAGIHTLGGSSDSSKSTLAEYFRVHSLPPGSTYTRTSTGIFGSVSEERLQECHGHDGGRSSDSSTANLHSSGTSTAKCGKDHRSPPSRYGKKVR
jgi:hypothetical protein